MKNFCRVLIISLFSFGLATADEPGEISFQKRQLTDKYYCDGINHGDFNRDGHEDIVAGPFCYLGPEFTETVEFYPAVALPPEPSPSDSMFSFVHDFNGDGWPDILVLGRVHKHAAYWYENPQGKPGHWPKHFVFERIRGESPPFQDVDGDGHPELVCHWENAWGLLKFDPRSPTKPWKFHPIMPAREEEWPQFYHGTGIGDINSDGCLDLILNEGWWEQPADSSQLWIEHRGRFSQDRGGAQMFAVDMNGDGRNDVITSLHAHEWGLAWFEQHADGNFVEHKIMGDRSERSKYGAAFSQPHALDVADINGDRLPDIITGKRMWAHGPKGDVEPEADPVLYWFELKRTDAGVKYISHEIDASSGVGVQVVATDINADGRMDILTVSKLGTFLFLQEK